MTMTLPLLHKSQYFLNKILWVFLREPIRYLQVSSATVYYATRHIRVRDEPNFEGN